MKLKVVTWNMDYWKRNKAARQQAWNYLSESLSPDLSLLQECKPPEKDDRLKYIFRAFEGKKMTWGCGVFSAKFSLEPEEIATGSPSTLVAANVDLGVGDILPENTNLTVISLYGDIDKWGRATPNLHKKLSDLTPLLLGDLGKRWVILGGDFNTSTQWEEGGRKWPGASASIFFERVKDFGLIDCTDLFYKGHVQTHRHSRSDRPWQNDYIFVNKALSKKLTQCEVINDREVQDLSDHNPVVLTFEL